MRCRSLLSVVYNNHLELMVKNWNTFFKMNQLRLQWSGFIENVFIPSFNTAGWRLL